MLSFKLLGLALTLCSSPGVLAQHNTTLVQLEAVRAHFSQAGLVPAVLPTLAPSVLLTVSFQGRRGITLGQSVPRELAIWEPSLSVTAANASAVLRGTYTLMMIDAGPPGKDQKRGQWRHWLINGVTLPAAASANVSLAGGKAITRYVAPNPPVGDGPHRYVLLLLAQPADFSAPPNLAQENVGGGNFMLQDYLKYTKLGPVVAASYFTCQRGPVTGSLPPTSAVVSATLPGWNGAQSTGAVGQKVNSGLSATRNALALVLAPIMGLLAL